MQIAINLSDSVYDAIKNKYTLVNPKEGTLIKTLWDAVENGTPLPKGHGRLKDVSKLTTITDIRADGSEYTYVSYDEIESASTIVEADRSVEE